MPAPEGKPATDPTPTGEHHLRQELHELGELLGQAAVEAELETGRREETEAEAKRHILVRAGRITAGVAVVILGILLMPLPGPGLLVVAAGLALLSTDVPFAHRLLQEVRRRLPEDENGGLPWWVVTGMVVGAVVATASSLWWTFLR